MRYSTILFALLAAATSVVPVIANYNDDYELISRDQDHQYELLERELDLDYALFERGFEYDDILERDFDDDYVKLAARRRPSLNVQISSDGHLLPPEPIRPPSTIDALPPSPTSPVQGNRAGNRARRH